MLDKFFFVWYHNITMAKKWGAISADITIYMDGKRIAAELFDAIAEELAGEFDDLRGRVSVRVAAWWLHLDGEEEARAIPTFSELLTTLHRERVGSVYVYDGETFFSFLEWALHMDDAHPWENITEKERRNERGFFEKVTGWKYAELSGALGQRYRFSVWSVGTDARKREVTRGTHIYAFRNIFPKGLDAACLAFSVPRSTCDASDLLAVVKAFDALVVENVGASWLNGGGVPLAMTAGTLARYDLFNRLYHNEDKKANDRAFKRAHPQNKGAGAYMRRARLIRGGVNVANAGVWGETLHPLENGERVHKYDVRSEYGAVARDMPDLRTWYEVPEKELDEPRADWTYIIIFDELHMKRKRDMPAVFTHPFNAKAHDTINIYGRDFAIFKEEFDELLRFYALQGAHVKKVLGAENEQNDGYRDFVDTWYSLKERAERDGNGGLRFLAKSMINNAWGQLSKKSAFPVCVHVYDAASSSFRLRTKKSKKSEEEDDGQFSPIMGALVASRGRVHIMRAIRRICGDRGALNTFVYTDTDSVAAYATAPADMVGAGIGQLKEEGAAVESKYIAKKVYYNIWNASPLSIDIHARGVAVEKIVRTACDAYGVDNFKDLPPDAFAAAFSAGMQYPTPALLQVDGGRVKMYVRKMLTVERMDVITTINGTRYTIAENGDFVEI